MVRKCTTCDSYMFKNEEGEWVCPECEANEVLDIFYLTEDFWKEKLSQL